jgi:sugar phosphate isomerase/epimerase
MRERDGMMDRRAFIGSAALLTAAGCVRASGPVMTNAFAPTSGRLPIGFSTLGCPKWDWLEALDFAAAHGYSAVELRGIKDTMDLPKAAEFQPERLAQTQRELKERGLVISDLGASTNLHETAADKGSAGMTEARAFIGLASRIGVPYVRVFGNKFVDGVPREQTLELIARNLRTLGEYARERNVMVLLETHGDFTDSPTILELMKRADSRGAAVLWDAHHTFVLGKESPETSVRELGSYIRHTHLKDSVPAAVDRRYVLTGAGEVPVRRQVEALARAQYKGFYSFEWEKRWHPEIEEPAVAFAQYATVVSGYLRDAGVRSA